jgi:hypothetical protein
LRSHAAHAPFSHDRLLVGEYAGLVKLEYPYAGRPGKPKRARVQARSDEHHLAHAVDCTPEQEVIEEAVAKHERRLGPIRPQGFVLLQEPAPLLAG